MAARPRVARRDLKEDKVYLTLAGVADLFVSYRRWIGLALLAVLVGFAAGYYWHLRAQDVATEASWALYQAQRLESSEEKVGALENVASEYGRSSAGRFASFEVGNALFDEGRFEDAIEAFRKFLQKNPNHLLAPSAMESIGYCRESLGQWKEAIEAYQQVIRDYAGTPAAARANYRLGLCFEKTGEKVKAVEAYETTMSLLPDTVWAEYANERLSVLRPPAPAETSASESFPVEIPLTPPSE